MQSVTESQLDWQQHPGWRLPLINFLYRARRYYGRRVRHLEKNFFRPPDHAQPLFSFAVLGGAIVFGLATGGHAYRAADQFAAAIGFGIEEVRIAGLQATSQYDILRSLDSLGAGSVPMMDSDAARQALGRLPWVETVSVSKLYPRMIAVNLTEKTPVARWQRGRDDQIAVIDQFGQVITRQISPDLNSLPLVVGEGAEYQVAEITGFLRRAVWLRSRVYAAVLVSGRRWNLITHEGVVIRLPENEIAGAIDRLRLHERSAGLLDKDIRVVDLRFSDRLIVRLSPEAADARRTEAKKAIKK